MRGGRLKERFFQLVPSISMSFEEACQFFVNYGEVAGPATALMQQCPNFEQLRRAVFTSVQKGQPLYKAKEAERAIVDYWSVNNP